MTGSYWYVDCSDGYTYGPFRSPSAVNYWLNTGTRLAVSEAYRRLP